MVNPLAASGSTGAWRRALPGLVLTLLVVTAGCAGLDSASAPGTETAAAAPSTTVDPATTSPAGTPTADESGTTTDGGSGAGDARATSSGPAADGTAAAGEMTVVVAGEAVTGSGVDTGSQEFQFEDGEPHTWQAEADVTLAAALSTLDIEATAETLTYQGTTYDESRNGTSVSVRVNGDPVDPRTYTLQDGDEVWVTVETPEMNVSTPGEYIDDEDQHIHGHLEFSVDGTTLDFSQERYQSNDRYFHFEGGEGASWHAHSYTITLQYALSSLDGMDVSADGRTVTVDGTTYRADDPKTTIRFEVNGEPVVPGEYLLKDWDGVRVVVEHDG